MDETPDLNRIVGADDCVHQSEPFLVPLAVFQQSEDCLHILPSPMKSDVMNRISQ